MSRRQDLARQNRFMQTVTARALPDEQAGGVPSLFEAWTPEWTGKRGDRLRDGGALYKSLHDVLTPAQNTRPSETPAMWELLPDPNEEWPAWYSRVWVVGDKVTHAGKKWVCVEGDAAGNNSWEPGVFGWGEA